MTYNEILEGDALDRLRGLPDQSVHCIVTSPPYWNLRDYGVAGQLGMESTPEEYVANIVAVFREAKRVLRDDGTLWLNIGDSYTSGNRKKRDHDKKNVARHIDERARTPEGLKQQNYIAHPMVRRLTPMECERLQGFPDGYTNIPGAADTPRYASIGNSMTRNVMAWLGGRIDKVDKLLTKLGPHGTP